jgi:hypothetical protein
VLLSIPPLSGTIPLSLYIPDLQRFYKSANMMLANFEGVAELDSIEDVLTIRIELASSGKSRISGTIRNSNSAEIVLSFAFGSDQSFLVHMLRELEFIIETYP